MSFGVFFHFVSSSYKLHILLSDFLITNLKTKFTRDFSVGFSDREVNNTSISSVFIGDH